MTLTRPGLAATWRLTMTIHHEPVSVFRARCNDCNDTIGRSFQERGTLENEIDLMYAVAKVDGGKHRCVVCRRKRREEGANVKTR